jgi:hypothetical protein
MDEEEVDRRLRSGIFQPATDFKMADFKATSKAFCKLSRVYTRRI